MSVKPYFSSSTRQIMHVDMDSFFASVAQSDDPVLQGRPVAVASRPGTRTVVSSASKEAKRYGVTSGMNLFEAARLCPEIILTPPCFGRYRRVHRQVFRILNKFTPEIEVFSIDEWFLDLTVTAARFGGVIAIARAIKAKLKEKLGDIITASVGIGPNKMLAKLASGLNKPNGLVGLRSLNRQEAAADRLRSLRLEQICGIGRRTCKHLARLAIFSLEDLANCPLDVLVHEFGQYGYQLKAWANGNDTSPLVPFYARPRRKSFVCSQTLPFNTLDYAYLRVVVVRLCEQIARRVRAKNLAGRTIRVWVRNQDFEHWSRQKTLSAYTNTAQAIFRSVWQLFLLLPIIGRVRAVGVSLSSLARVNQLPLLFKEQRQESLAAVVSQVNQKFGRQVLFPAERLLT